MRAGDAEHCLYLCRHLAEAGHDVHVLTTRKNIACGQAALTVYPVIQHWGWRAVPVIARLMRQVRPDVILLIHASWLYGHHPMVTFLPSIAKWVQPNVRFVTLFEILYAPWHGGFFGRALRKAAALWAGEREADHTLGTLLRDSDRIVVLSEADLATLTASTPTIAEKGIVIPPPPLVPMTSLSLEAARQLGRRRLGLQPETIALGFFGYVDHTKGLDTFVEALRLVRDRGRDVRLVMIGGGRSVNGTTAVGSVTTAASSGYQGVAEYEVRIHDLVRRLGLVESVVWTPGYDSESDEASVYLYAMDACVLPFDQGVTLRRSSFSVACAHGLPIITTRGKTLESAFVNYDNVLLCQPKNPTELADAIESLIAHPDLRAQLHKGALELSRQWLSWESCYRKLIAAFQPEPGSHVPSV